MPMKDDRVMLKSVVNLCRDESREPMERKRTAAKIGMALSLGTAVTTGLMQGRGSRVLHLFSAVALVGFSVWHNSLYQSATRGNKR